MVPDKIYIFQDGDELWYKPEEWETPPTNRVEYIRKDTLLEWANDNLLECETSNDDADYGRIDAYKKLIDKINSL